MLQKVRKIADNFLMKCLLGLIAFAFVGWGIKDVLQDQNNFEVVTFKNAPHITNKEFLKSRAETITYLQRQHKINLDEETIKKMGINEQVLQRLIDTKMLDYLVSYYDLIPGENMMIKYLKQRPEFKQDNGNFDINLLRGSIRNSGLRESEYIDNFRHELTRNVTLQIFAEGFNIPKQMTQNMINYLAENYNLDIVKINLNNQKKVTGFTAPISEELEKYYQTKIELFRIPEKRDIKYLKIPAESINNKTEITEEEITNFYNENKEELDDQTLAKARPQIKEKIKKQKYEQNLAEQAKNIEDSVASGSSLDEVAQRLNLKVQVLLDISEQNINKQKIALNEIVDNIFEMKAGEVSYPVELKDKSGILLIEIKQIKPGLVQEYNVVREQVLTTWENEKFKELNYQALKNLAKDYIAGKADIKNLSAAGINVDQKFSISRNDFANNTTLPTDLLVSIFQTPIGSNTMIFVKDNDAYFAHVKSKNIDSNKVKEIEKSSKNKIEAWLKNGVFEELVTYLRDINDTKVNLDDHILAN